MADPNTFSSYNISRETFMDGEGRKYFKISETIIDCLAFLRVNSEGQAQIQGETPDQWVTVDFTRQRLGLAVITAKEGNNSMARFWAKTFVFDKE